MGEPTALVEYNHFCPRPIAVAPTSISAPRPLADRAGIPLPAALYWPGGCAFRVHPLDDLAREHFDDPGVLSQRAYVQRLYRLCRLTLTRALSESLLDVLPPVERRRPTQSTSPIYSWADYIGSC